jgi:hypothetical protein
MPDANQNGSIGLALERQELLQKTNPVVLILA